MKLTESFVEAVGEVQKEGKVEQGADADIQQVPVDGVGGQVFKLESEPRKGQVVVAC